ncbi:hypothetical protein TD95_001517 [Thielaviopsis punctulata]|uniref:C3HC-type domain-containing protein n=1 Tax=Thielaviopsis punctulata TaxID=72032 RepID=A0A0F4ZJG5_9PEZI|nr:hypothetical protein TD95_001517 [Thielaviopsis punctulata]
MANVNATKRKFNALLQGMGNRSTPSTPTRDNNSATPMPVSDRYTGPLADSAMKRRRLGPNETSTILTSAPGSTTTVSNVALRKWSGGNVSRNISPMNEPVLPAVTTKVTNVTPPMLAAKYCPADREELIRRLATFQDISDWTPKPDRVSEIEWARRGWICQGKERVRCTLCHKELVVKFSTKEVDGKEVPGLTPLEVENALVVKYHELMTTAHQENCLWRQAGCDESLLRISFSDTRFTLESLQRRYLELISRADSLPYMFDLKLPEEIDLDLVISQLPDSFFNGSSSAPKSSPNKVALALALMGWQGLTNTRIGALTNSASCHTCLRRLGLWMFKSKEIAPDGTVTVPAAMDFLDPAREHRFFCPWKNTHTQRLPTARLKKGETMPAWKVLGQLLRNDAFLRECLTDSPAGCMQRRRSRSELVSGTPSKEGGGEQSSDSIGAGDRDAESRDARDKERWARLRRVKSLFEAKGSKKKKSTTSQSPSRPGTGASSTTELPLRPNVP